MEENYHTIATLHELLHYEASKFTASEIQLKHSLGEWINQAGSLQLKTVLQKYLGFVQQHVQKLESFLEEEKISSLSISDRVMKAFVEEADQKMKYCADTEVKDACLLACIQAINHFKISEYGTAAAFAKELNMEKSATVFHEMEINEKHIDDRLSQLAEYEINRKARAPIVIAG
jgi:ferritin-like metal-binding protein YciE